MLKASESKLAGRRARRCRVGHAAAPRAALSTFTLPAKKSVFESSLKECSIGVAWRFIEEVKVAQALDAAHALFGLVRVAFIVEVTEVAEGVSTRFCVGSDPGSASPQARMPNNRIFSVWKFATVRSTMMAVHSSGDLFPWQIDESETYIQT